MSTSVSLQGRELIAEWSGIDRGTAAWILKLAEFDDGGEWRLDGHATCAAWLTDKCELSRTEAFAKLKVSHELMRRPVVRAALEQGLPYTKVFWLVRLDRIDHERDIDFVAYAKQHTVNQLEDRVRTWNYYHGQDDKPTNLDDHYGIVRLRGFAGGLGKVVIEAPDAMLDAMFGTIDAYGGFLRHNSNSAQLRLQPVDESGNRTHPQDTDPAQRPRPRHAERLDWLLDLLQEVKLSEASKLDPHGATVGVTIQYEDLIAATGHGLSDQGSTLSAEAVRQLCCDAGIVRIVVKGQSEILDYGREQRLFPPALRRLIRFRHGHRCAARGCGRRITYIHHMRWWDQDGETTVDNGIPLCMFHHHLVHEGGWQIVWNPTTGVVTLEGPQGQVLETTASFLSAA